eukprot:COSAG01_NODE_6118_length_3842_cov_3.927064_5_plen_65_part_00
MLPPQLQQRPAPHQKTAFLAVDPTDAATLYAVNGGCMATSRDQGQTWSECTSPGNICHDKNPNR